MKQSLRVILVVAIVAPLMWWRFGRFHPPKADPADHAATAPTPSAPTPPSKVVKLRDPAERQQIAELIAKAAASRRRHAADMAAAEAAEAAGSAKPALLGGGSNTMDTPKHVVGHMIDALQQVNGFLTECAKHAPGIDGFKAKLALTGDPDVGTLIDIDGSAMTRNDDTPLPPPFVDCVQDVLMDLELPPMAVGDHYKLDFNFGFADPK